MIVIAKRGGVSAEVERFLYFSRDLRIWLQYRLITLNQTGYLLALGRHLFPLCLLELAMVYSMAGRCVNIHGYGGWHWLCPLSL